MLVSAAFSADASVDESVPAETSDWTSFWRRESGLSRVADVIWDEMVVMAESRLGS